MSSRYMSGADLSVTMATETRNKIRLWIHYKDTQTRQRQPSDKINKQGKVTKKPLDNTQSIASERVDILYFTLVMLEDYDSQLDVTQSFWLRYFKDKYL